MLGIPGQAGWDVLGVRNATTAGNAGLDLGLLQTLALQRMLRSQQVSNSAKMGIKG